jgi:hypothetical protein
VSRASSLGRSWLSLVFRKCLQSWWNRKQIVPLYFQSTHVTTTHFPQTTRARARAHTHTHTHTEAQFRLVVPCACVAMFYQVFGDRIRPRCAPATAIWWSDGPLAAWQFSLGPDIILPFFINGNKSMWSENMGVSPFFVFRLENN